MSCPIIFNSNTIELTVHTSCYWVLDLLNVNLSSLTVWLTTVALPFPGIWRTMLLWLLLLHRDNNLPHLLSIDDPLVSLLLSFRLNSGHVGSGSGLGHSVRAHDGFLKQSAKNMKIHFNRLRCKSHPTKDPPSSVEFFAKENLSLVFLLLANGTKLFHKNTLIQPKRSWFNQQLYNICNHVITFIIYIYFFPFIHYI